MNPMHRGMLKATRLTRAGRLADATALLQRLLRDEMAPSGTFVTEEPSQSLAERAPRRIDLEPDQIELAPDQIEATEARPSSRVGQLLGSGVGGQSTRTAEQTGSPHMPDALTSFLAPVNRLSPTFRRTGLARPPVMRAPEILPEGAQFLAGSYSDGVGTRAYKLYVPSGYHGQALPLIVMLHGCTQSPDDFAAGTRMNHLAEEHTCVVVYPAQSMSANRSKCWNWFSPGDQRRDRGEPALIAGITHQIMRDYAVDPQRVYVAGLSAGAAAAAIMGNTYPDLYAAIGVHSGLVCGAASDLPSAFAAMHHGKVMAGTWNDHERDVEPYRRVVPTIVFHGDQDTTVNPCNGDQIIAQLRASVRADLRVSVENGEASGGHAYSRTLYVDESGRSILEQWVVRGAGHAWSGGSLAGSYTDPLGPDASKEMLRFFLDHAYRDAA